ncbi:hypothetical protein [Actinomadura sp. HBU206391]|nr:hypothetical protein [Actinomadura sp. HBU206391]MBC6456991.1 hypothetical protein [Actinomadura sp. HBU206391]
MIVDDVTVTGLMRTLGAVLLEDDLRSAKYSIGSLIMFPRRAVSTA